MNRRDCLSGMMLGATVAVFGSTAGAQALPKRKSVRAAFLLGDSANVIDTAGPWEVFQDTMIDGLLGHAHPFELYTVAPDDAMLRMTGGLQVVPQYSVETAPEPNVIVVPAHRSTESSRAWLKRMSERTDVTMSVCTGAFQLARVGLLDGLPATTHHDFWDSFAREFPGVELRRGLRFVDNGRIATAGGLTSGIDMALHVVERYFGTEVAQATARYMEYSSEAWRTGADGATPAAEAAAAE
jgi:transcriptional regulator GlxA family with amidase domain